MYFKLTGVDYDDNFTVHNFINFGRQLVAMHRLTPNEKNLDKYLRKEFNIGLIDAAFALMHYIRINRNKSGDTIITFKDSKADKLASLITYGNGRIQGSDLLVQAFGGR